MKLIVRSTIAVLFLTALAMPSLAQSPHVAVRVSPQSTTQQCFTVTIRNLRTTPIGCTAAYLTIYDQKTCKVTCEFKVPLGRRLGSCQVFRFKICCDKPVSAAFIAHVRINHAQGNDEGWYYLP